MVDPWKVPPVKAAPVNPVEAVIVVPLTVVPWNVPPLKAAPVNPVEAVMVLPEKAVPVKFAAVTYPVVACVTERPPLAMILVPTTCKFAVGFSM